MGAPGQASGRSGHPRDVNEERMSLPHPPLVLAGGPTPARRRSIPLKVDISRQRIPKAAVYRLSVYGGIL